MKAEKFNQTQFSKLVNSTGGRVFRLAAGLAFFLYGITHLSNPLGIASIVWSFFPLTAGGFDLCFISGALGGSWKGSKIRSAQSKSKSS